MSDTLARASWTAFSVALGGALASGGLMPVAAAAIVLGAAAGVSRSRWVQERVWFLRTDKQRLRTFYGSCYALRGEFNEQKKDATLEAWDAWSDRLRKWDEPFLKHLKSRRDDWQPLWRSVYSPPAKPYSNWKELVQKGIDSRLALIDLLFKN